MKTTLQMGSFTDSASAQTAQVGLASVAHQSDAPAARERSGADTEGVTPVQLAAYTCPPLFANEVGR